ncbi:MAG: hypothetical protein AB7S68_08230 [Polyangiaceae bacterium]
MTPIAATEPNPKGRKGGRPRKADPPRIRYDELDHLLVYGELIEREGREPEIRYPTYRQLADKYGVALSVIADYSKRHRCRRRRGEAAMRLAVRAEDKLIEKRATKLATNKSGVLAIIDTYIDQFREALKEGRVRVDSVSDFNTIMRLKEFLEGGADSRQEVHTTLTLEQLQLKHKQALQRQDEVDDELSGNVPCRKRLVEADGDTASNDDEGDEEDTEPLPTEHDDEPDEDEDEDEEPFVPRVPVLPALSRARFPRAN